MKYTYNKILFTLMLILGLAGCGTSTTSTTGGGAAPTTPAQVPTTISYSAGDVIITGTIASASGSLSKSIVKSTTDEEYDIYAVNGLNFFNKATSAVVYEGTFVGDNFYLPIPAGSVYALIVENSSGQKFLFEHPSLDLSSVPIYTDGISEPGNFEVETSASTASISSTKAGLLSSLLGATSELAQKEICVGTLTLTPNIEIATLPGTMTGTVTDDDLKASTGSDPEQNTIQQNDAIYGTLTNLFDDWNGDGNDDWTQNLYNLLTILYSFTSDESPPSLVGTYSDPAHITYQDYMFYFESTLFNMILPTGVQIDSPAYGDITLTTNYGINEAFTGKSNNVYTTDHFEGFPTNGATFTVDFGGFAYAELVPPLVVTTEPLESIPFGPIDFEPVDAVGSINIFPSISFTGTADAVTGVSIKWVRYENAVATELTDEEVARDIYSVWVGLNYDSNYFVTPLDRSDYNEVSVIGDDIDVTTATVTVPGSGTFDIDAIGYLYISVVYKSGGITKTFRWN